MPTAGVLSAAGYSQETYHYRIGYRDVGQKIFITPDWQLDNYYLDPKFNTLKPKGGPNYEATREFDADGDGVISDFEKTEEFIYDLRFTHAKDDGIIWVKAHPVAASDARRDLEVELGDYADGMAGTGLYAQGNLFNLEKVKARTYTTFVTSKHPVTVGPLSGIVGEIELADTERLRIDSKYRSGKVKVLLARFVTQPAPRGRATMNRPASSVQSSSSMVPALLIVGYYNTAAKFDEHVKDFDLLLGQLSLSPGSSAAGADGANVDAGK
jgi:hypothetical protein